MDRLEKEIQRPRENDLQEQTRIKRALERDRKQFELEWEKAQRKSGEKGDKLGGFEDKGIRDVNPHEVALPEDFPKHWERTPHGYSRKEIEESLRRLPEVQKLIKRGWSENNFSELAGSSAPEKKALARTHETYYGNGRIKLTKEGNKPYEVTNGMHRLQVAQELGIKRIPAHIHERTG